MKAREVRKLLNITTPTLSKYVKIGKLKVNIINSHHYIYDEDSVYALIGNKKQKHNKINISYSRVSTNGQREQLKLQTQRIYEYCISKGIQLDKQLEDIKSAMNFSERKSFNDLIENVIAGKVELIIIENKDRLARFGFDLIETIFKYYGTKILIINDEIQNKSYEQEMTDDLIAIIHYFSMKSYSNRRKLNKIKAELLDNN